MRNYSGTAISGLVLLLCAGCSVFNSPSHDFAQRNEAAIQRQEAEMERPALDNTVSYTHLRAHET